MAPKQENKKVYPSFAKVIAQLHGDNYSMKIHFVVTELFSLYTTQKVT